MTGTPTAAHIRARSRSPSGVAASTFDGVVQTGPTPEEVGVPRFHFLKGCGRTIQDQASLSSDLRTRVALAEVDAVGVKCERGLDVVVDNERCGERPEPEAARDQLVGRYLHP